MPVQRDCPVCFGAGGWADPIAQQSIRCPSCRPSEYAAASTCADGGWLKGYPRLPCKNPGPAFPVRPWLIVLHCGATNGDVAAFMRHVGFWTKKLPGGETKRVVVSAHFNWANDLGGLSQGVPLSRVAWHVGGSTIEPDRLRNILPDAPMERLRKLNFCSIGVELQGPAGRRFSVGEHNRVRDLALRLQQAGVPLRVATRHQDICPTKRDPGRQFDMDVFKEAGLHVYG